MDTLKGLVLEGKAVYLWLEARDQFGRICQPETFYPPVRTNANGHFVFKGVTPQRTLTVASCDESLSLRAEELPKGAEREVQIIAGKKTATLSAGTPMPAVTLLDVKGDKVLLDPSVGRLCVLYLWDTWCLPCRNTLPHLNEIAKDMSSKGVDFVTIEIGNDFSRWQRVLSELPSERLKNYWFDGTLNDEWLHRQGVPFYVLMDKAGMIRALGYDMDVRAEIEKIVQTDGARVGPN